MQSMKYRCPNHACRVMLAVPVEMQGQRVKCAGCDQMFLVPPTDIGSGRVNKNGRRHSGHDHTSLAA